MFNYFKKRKAEKLNQKNFETRMRIKQTLNRMKTQSNKLDEFKMNYIEKAKKASLEGDQKTYNLAKNGLKICLTKQKFLNQMVANCELSLELSDMNKVVTEFMSAINVLGEQMQTVTSGIDMSKAQVAYEKALANNASQYEALDTFLSETNNSFDSLNESTGASVSDDEIDKLISNQAADQVEEIDHEIDCKINRLRERMSAAND